MNILAQIKKISIKKTLSPAIICIAIVASIFIIPFKTVLNPVVVNDIWKDNSRLETLDYVQVTVDKMYYTGYDATSISKSKYSYYYTIKNNQCFLFLIPCRDTPEQTLTDYTFKGSVVPKNSNPSYDKLTKALSTDVAWNEVSLNKATAPYIISAADYHPWLYVGIMAVLFFIFAFQFYQLILHLARCVNPYLYPICPHATVNHKEAFVNDVNKQIDEHLILHQEDMYLTDKFLVEYNNKEVIVVPLSTVVWCYRIGTLNYRISHHKPKYNLHVVLLSGDDIVFENKDSESTNSILESLRNMNRDFILGYSDSRRKAAKKLTKEYLQKKYDLEKANRKKSKATTAKNDGKHTA